MSSGVGRVIGLMEQYNCICCTYHEEELVMNLGFALGETQKLTPDFSVMTGLTLAPDASDLKVLLSVESSFHSVLHGMISFLAVSELTQRDHLRQFAWFRVGRPAR